MTDEQSERRQMMRYTIAITAMDHLGPLTVEDYVAVLTIARAYVETAEQTTGEQTTATLEQTLSQGPYI